MERTIKLPFAVILFSPFAAAITILPATACYVVFRLLARRLRVNCYNRVAIGMLLGAVLNGIIVLSSGLGEWHKQQFHENLVLNLYFLFSEIQVTTVLVASLSRKRWFGLA